MFPGRCSSSLTRPSPAGPARSAGAEQEQSESGYPKSSPRTQPIWIGQEVNPTHSGKAPRQPPSDMQIRMSWSGHPGTPWINTEDRVQPSRKTLETCPPNRQVGKYTWPISSLSTVQEGNQAFLKNVYEIFAPAPSPFLARRASHNCLTSAVKSAFSLYLNRPALGSMMQ